MKESIYAALSGEYGERVLPPVGTAYHKDVFSALADGELDGIPNINTEIVKELFQTFKPQDYDDMLKLIGYALGSCIGDNQSEKPLAECVCLYPAALPHQQPYPLR